MKPTGTCALPEMEDKLHLRPTAKSESHVAIEATAQQRPRILLVDDDTHILDLHRRMLCSMGYTRNTTLTSGRDALLQLEHDPQSVELIVCVTWACPVWMASNFCRHSTQAHFAGSVILVSGESARVMHSVQRLSSAADS